MKLGKKVFLACLGVLLFAVVELVLFFVFNYVMFKDYKDVLTTYTVEEGTDYKPLQANAKEGYDLIAKDGGIELYAMPKSGEIAVYDIANDKWYTSTPEGIDEDPIANQTNKNILKSQIVINYFNSNRNEATYNSYEFVNMVDPNQLSVESLKDGVRFNYYFKQKLASNEMVPYVMTIERYESFYNQMESKTQKKMDQFYKINEDEGVYEIVNSMKEGTGALRSYDTIYKALYNEAGYTDADLALDMEGTDLEINLKASFKVSVDYRVVDGGLQVNVPTSKIQEFNGSLYTIELLPGFGYANNETDGYFVIPNGSGSLINFNNGKDIQYSGFIYGIDPVSANYTKVENADTIKLPIYGVCYDNASILAEIEEGASLGRIKTQTTGGKLAISSYNTTDFVFNVRGRETLSMFGSTGNAADFPIVEKNFADCNIQVRYNFLGEENSGYSGLANYYRDKLVAKGDIEKLGDLKSTSANDIGYYYDVIGAVKMTDFFLGVQYLGVESMTTFSQAKEMAEFLADKGVKNQIVNYQGWFNGGYYHDVADKVKVVSKLGSKGKFEDLAEYVEGLGGKVYADVALQKVTDITKRFNTTFEAAKYYAGYALEFGQVNPASLRQTAGLGYRETLFTVVSPKFLVRYVDKFISKTDSLDVTGISLRDLGDYLSSDKKRTEVIDREHALDVVEAQLQKFDDNGDKQVMISGGNDYAVKYADDIINAPIGHNNYYSVDKEIPLYEMIYHGYVDYASYNINVSDTYDVDDISLRLIEYGCAPHFVYTYDEANEMKYSGLNQNYATTFDTWKDVSVEIYNKVNDALKYVKNAEIVDHKTTGDGQSVVTYSNGVVFYVNASDVTADIDGVKVEAKNYVMKGVN